MKINRSFLGYSSAALAAITFGLNPLFGLNLYKENVSTPTVLFYRFLFGALMLGVMMCIQKKSFVMPLKCLPSGILLGFCLFGTSLGLFLGFRFMDAGIASTIGFAYPVIVAMIMTVFFREKMTLPIFAGIVLSVAGTIVLCRTSSGALISMAGLIFSVISAVLYATYIVALKQTKLAELAPETVTFYAMIFCLPFYIVVPDFKFSLPSSVMVYLNLIGLALFPSFLSYYLLALGVKFIGATKSSLLGALEPLTAVIICVTIFKEEATWRLGGGLVLILASVFAVIFSDKLKFQKSSERKSAEAFKS